ncbi:MAG: tetratricopeptide repeat protein [Polyangiales bacterium]
MPDKSNTSVSSLRRLRKRVERALADGARAGDVVRDLETIVREAGDGDRDGLFAHRQLAELRLEEFPWRAALHLRKLMQANAADDGVHALMGLCQAMLGNFRAAISAYHRAIDLAPRNPWYHHNLGHLLDVGLGSSQTALRHLRLAHQLEPREDEIGASLAHCLARLGQLDEARRLAGDAVRSAPDNSDHRSLLEWIDRGAPGMRINRRAGAPGRARVQVPGRGREQVEATDAVARMLVANMPEAGFSQEHMRRAQALYLDFCARHDSCDARASREAKPAAYAAAIEYAIAMVHGVRGVTQAALARRYGVAPASISGRYTEIRGTLDLVPGDPRYSVAR